MRQWIVLSGFVIAWCLGGRVEAGPVRFTYTGTVTDVEYSGSTSPFAVGDPVTYFLTVADGVPTPGTSSATAYNWTEETAADPSLWMNGGGTQISGIFQKAPASAPWERLGLSSDGQVEMRMSTDSFDNATNNHGISWTGDPNVKIKDIYIYASWNGLAFATPGPLPSNPASYLASYFGTYTLDTSFDAHVRFGNNDTYVSFTPNTLTIGAEPSAVPEPSTWVLMGVGALAVGYVSRQRKAVNV